MLLVRPPTRDDISRVVQNLFDGRLTRAEIVTWQKAVVAECGWQIPANEAEGYWYFYSLEFVDLRFPGGYFLRQQDFAEYLLDMDHSPGEHVADKVRHLRTFEINRDLIRWPLALIEDDGLVMDRLPSSRGTFERRGDMVEHCHLGFQGHEYLLVKQFDERTGEILLLGSQRSPEQAQALLRLLEINPYMLP